MPSEPERPASAPPPAALVDDPPVLAPAAVVAFTEGPAADRDGSLYFSDIANNRILRLSATGNLSVFRDDAGRANGNLFDARGRLVTCEGGEHGPGGRRRLVRADLDTGETVVLAERFAGKRFNSPNDLAIDRCRRIYFTDPRYGDQSGRELDEEAVYRLDPDGGVGRIAGQPEVQKPNGIAVSPDDRTLYLVDSNPAPGGNRKIWAFTLDGAGTLSEQRLVYDFGTGRGGDGLRTDRDGNLWVAAGINAYRGRPGESLTVPAGIYHLTPRGRLLGRIPIPEDSVTNLTFGPPDHTTLFVTAGKSIFRFRLRVSGHALW